MEWIKAIEASEDVLWLYGSAGSGKSAIVQTIAEMCAKMGLLVASFFFSRVSECRNNEKRLVASIAYQLAISIPPTRSYIGSAIEIDPAIFDRSLDTQVETLIIRPLESAYADVKAAYEQWPRLIIIDGLDECHGPLIQCSIIRILSAALIRIPVPLILLVASRPEPHIRSTFILLNKSHASRHIVLDGSYKPDADIRVLLLSRFKEIKENHPFSAYIPESWPSEEVIHRLVRKSSGQFIYASTVMKYLDCPKHQPMKRLDVILGLRSVDGDMPYKELDALYRYIFSCVEDFAITLKILGFLFFQRHWNSRLLTLLLGLDEEDIYSHLSELHSILYITPPNNAGGGGGLKIRPTHASLQDFLVDKLRSGKYYLDEEVFHTDLALRCLRHIRNSTLSPNLRHRRQELIKGVDLSYVASSFIHHCTQVSADSVDLKNELMQVCDLRPFSEIWPIIIDGLPSLFAWLYKVHILSTCYSSSQLIIMKFYIG